MNSLSSPLGQGQRLGYKLRTPSKRKQLPGSEVEVYMSFRDILVLWGQEALSSLQLEDNLICSPRVVT